MRTQLISGQEFRFPSKKADPPSPQVLSRSNSFKDDKDAKVHTRWVLHSPLSPLTPTSILYPDGLFDPAWISKQQEQVPCLFVAIFDLTSDTNTNSLNDNKLKTEISDIRSSISKSGYRTRFAVILLSDKAISEAPDIEERLSNIRRGTGLDSKNGLFFLPPNSSRLEVTSFVTSFITTLQPLCIEYYRDLTKHSRRKRNRGSVPLPTIAPTTSSQALSSYGWNIRYDVKQGVFAEFRQEMDAACRHYTTALEGLMNSDGIFETTASWSPRWNEGRILADMMAFRIIRCLLWSHMGTTAAQSWVNYRDRMRELVDRRGKGSTNYGWEAWESRWAKVMAQLIRRADVTALSLVDSLDLTVSTTDTKTGNTTYLIPERAVQPADSIPPWHYLHHPGYWLRLSARNSKRRRRYAMDIPEENRIPPAQSPASAVAQRSSTYDLYLAPEPHEEYPMPPAKGFDHGADIIDRLSLASQTFKEREQTRFSERMQLEIGRELLRKGSFQDAVTILKPLWLSCSWRKERWWMPLFELIRTLSESAKGARDIGVLAGTIFELHSPYLRLFRDMKLDLINCGKALRSETLDEKPSIQLSAESTMSFLNASIVFSSEHGNVGITSRAQLRIFSTAHQNTAPIIFSKITANLKPNRFSFELIHDPDLPHLEKASEISFIDITKDKLTSSTNSSGTIIFSARANLTFQPSQRTVYLLGFDVKDPGELVLESLDFQIDTRDFQLTYNVGPAHFAKPNVWFLSGGSKGLREKRIGRETPWIIDIRPKPPKLEMLIHEVSRSMYTDETIKLNFEITNSEEEQVSATIDVRLLSKENTTPEMTWLAHADDSNETIHAKDGSDPSRSHSLPALEPGESCIRTATFTAPSNSTDIVIEAKLHYFLLSDPDVPLSKIYTANLKIDSAFEANYEFGPSIHGDLWPSFFSIDKAIPGLSQRWSLTTNLASFAAEEVLIKKVNLEMLKVPKGLILNVESGNEDEYEIAPRTMHAHHFYIHTTRPAVKEHRQMTICARINVTWARQDDSATDVTSTLLVSPLVLPPLEPRVVATAKHASFLIPPSVATSPTEPLSGTDTTESMPFTSLTLTLENPSQHPLTFDITAPSAESLAFSGPKQQGVTLLPYSRINVGYRMLPLVHGGNWVNFGVKVSDRYFARDVPVLAGEGAGLKWWVE